MKNRGFVFPNPTNRDQILEVEPPVPGVRVHDRPQYTLNEARQVCAWINGAEHPLAAMKDREADEWDPVNRRNWHFARADGQRRGLAPLRDKR